MSEAYSDFAQVYDELMDNIPYEEWFSYLEGLLSEYGIRPARSGHREEIPAEQGEAEAAPLVSAPLVAELGCGTGNMTELMAAAGYSMIGIDNSPDMLDIARYKADGSPDILYLCQDMREFELYGTVAAVVSICDSINYVTDADELIQVFKLVNNYLDPGGIFIFDFNTRKYYKDTVGSSTIAESRDNISFIWDNYYDEETDINELELTLFMRADCDTAPCDAAAGDMTVGESPEHDGRGNDLFRRHVEYHYQRGYTLSEIKSCIEAAGLEYVNAFKAFTKEAASEDDDRIYVIAREHGKSGS